MSVSSSSLIRGIFIQLISILLYFGLQFILIRVLAPSLFAVYSSLNSVSIVLGHLSSLGSDGRLYSEVVAKPSLRISKKDFFSYFPYYLLFAFLILIFSFFFKEYPSYVVLSGALFLCVTSFCQPLLSNVIAISFAKSVYLPADITILAPSLSRLIIAAPIFFVYQVRLMDFQALPSFLALSSASYLLATVLCFAYAYSAINRHDQSSILILPHTFIIKKSDSLNYLVSTLSSLAPLSLLLPIVLKLSSEATLRQTPSLALALVIATFMLNISRQFWIRLKMRSISLSLDDVGSIIFSSHYFKFSVIQLISLQLLLLCIFIVSLPVILSSMHIVGYHFFRLYMLFVSPFVLISSLSTPLALLCNRVDLVRIRTVYGLLAASISLVIEVTGAFLQSIPIACVGLSLYPLLLYIFFLRSLKEFYPSFVPE